MPPSLRALNLAFLDCSVTLWPPNGPSFQMD